MYSTQKLFGELYPFLENMGYLWQPMIPEQLLKSRANSKAFPVLSRYFGLGMTIDLEQLTACGFPIELRPAIDSMRLAISRSGAYFVPHSHWPIEIECADEYVHFGQESLLFIHQLYRYWKHFAGKRVLDLGCSSGSLAIELSQIAEYVLGIDASERAINWAVSSAKVQHAERLKFIVGTLGHHFYSEEVSSQSWDIAVFNPPLAISRKSTQAYRYRDGGKFGLELPILFLDFAESKLNNRGEVFCLMTNPIVCHKSLLFDQLKKRPWIVKDQICLNPWFNHQLSETDDYRSMGVERIELYFLHLLKS